jgi:spermidine synthase
VKKYGRTVIFSGHDDHNPVEVVEDENTRSLHFGTPNYESEMSLQNTNELVGEYRRLMTLSLLFNPSPKSILMLGLGGGSLPKFLWKCLPRCHLDLVERSSLVVDVCYRYFALPQSPRLRVHVEDAARFIQSSREPKYDLLFIDLFDGEGMPEWPVKTDFFALCRNRLKNKKSLLALNVLWGDSGSLALRYLQQVTAAFGQNILVLPTKNGGNYIFLAFPEGAEFPIPWVMLQRAAKLQEKTSFPFSQLWVDLQKHIQKLTSRTD